MEDIVTLEEAVAYIGNFIRLDDIPRLEDLEYATIIGAGFEEVDENHYSHPSGYKLTVRLGAATMTYDSITVRIGVHQRGSYYGLRGDFDGLLIVATISLEDGWEITYVCLQYCNIGIDCYPNRTFTQFQFVDDDGRELRKNARWNNGVLTNMYVRDDRHRLHCISGPASIRGGKIGYYIDGTKLSKKEWKERKKM